MNRQNPIDELFRRHLEQASAPVSDDMWDRIQRARQPQKRKRVPFWWWTGLGILLPVALLGAYWLSSSYTDATIQQGNFPIPTEVDEQTPTVPAAKVPVATIPLTPKANESVAQIILTPASKQLSSTTTAVTNLAKLSAKQNRREASIQGDKSAITNLTTTNTTETTFNENDVAIRTELAETVEPTPASDDQEDVGVYGPHRRAKVQAIATLPANDFAWHNDVDWDKFVSHAPKCAKFTADFLHFDLDVMAGPAYAHQMLQLRTSEARAHLEDRQNSESSSLSYSAGIRLSAMSNTGLGLRLGLNYNQINETFAFNVGSRIDISTVYGPNGEIIGMDTTHISAYVQESTNKLRFLEVPVLLAYETQCGHLRLGVNAGAMLNLFFDASGSIYSPAGDDQPMAFGQTGDLDVLPLFKSQATAAWYASATVAYNLKNRYSIVAEPYFRSFPRALSNVDYSLQQNYWQMGLQMGLRMRL